MGERRGCQGDKRARSGKSRGRTKPKFIRSVVLLSGGLDSTTCLCVARRDSGSVIALTFDYGQRHSRELRAAQTIARAVGVDAHLILPLHLGHKASALLDRGMRLRSSGVPTRGSERKDVPATYVPARNLVFLAHAISLAEGIGAEAVYIGVTWPDSSGYPDCTPRFIDTFRKAAAVGTRCGVSGKRIQVMAPLQMMEKKDIIQLGTSLGAPYHLTWSCYRGGKRACGKCDSCRLRRKGFKKAGLRDPVPYGR